jgi:predicted SprT family Zn-dependent metalloprotease
MVKVERIENRQLLLAATDSALLNVIDHKLKHNKNDMMTLRYSSDDKKWEEYKKIQNKTS